MLDTNSIDDGYIKYNQEHILGDAPAHLLLNSLDEMRTKLFDMGLIGIYDNGIGFGNLSIRSGIGNSFIITGSATGGQRVLGSDGYVLVKEFNLKNNSVKSIGKIAASSESMTHGAIYETEKRCNAVIHIHSMALFNAMLHNNYPKTPKKVAYGTPNMAKSISKLVKNSKSDSGIFVTEGHTEGVIAFAPSIEIAGELIISTYNQLIKN